MGTRGAIGFRFNEADKITYNHFDSYPTGIGKNILETICKWDDEQLAGAASRLELVDEESTPTPELCDRYRRFSNSGVSTGQITEWYVLLRELQGDLDPFIAGTVDHLPDSHTFLADSLFCEWAYILNCDARALEVYVGFQTTPGAGRYATLGGASYGYFGVSLLDTVPFDAIRRMNDVERARLLAKWEDRDEEEGA